MNTKFDCFQNNMLALQAENCDCHNEQIQEALHAGWQERGSDTSSDKISELTDVVSRVNSVESRLNAEMDQVPAAVIDAKSIGTSSTDGTTNTNPGPTTVELIAAEKTKPPSFHSHMCGEKGSSSKKNAGSVDATLRTGLATALFLVKS